MHEYSVNAENKDIDTWICKSLVERMLQDAESIDQLKFLTTVLNQMKDLVTLKFKKDFVAVDFCQNDQIDQFNEDCFKPSIEGLVNTHLFAKISEAFNYDPKLSTE